MREREDDYEQCIRFGSFSLEDVFEQEIRSHGHLAFRGNQSRNQSAARFVSFFAESMSQEFGEQDRIKAKRDEQRSSPATLNRGDHFGEDSGAGVVGKLDPRPDRPK
jgi:hypothetical protein